MKACKDLQEFVANDGVFREVWEQRQARTRSGSPPERLIWFLWTQFSENGDVCHSQGMGLNKEDRNVERTFPPMAGMIDPGCQEPQVSLKTQ